MDKVAYILSVPTWLWASRLNNFFSWVFYFTFFFQFYILWWFVIKYIFYFTFYIFHRIFQENEIRMVSLQCYLVFILSDVSTKGRHLKTTIDNSVHYPHPGMRWWAENFGINKKKIQVLISEACLLWVSFWSIGRGIIWFSWHI